MVAFIGGLSASTAMVVFETIALSIMICNNLVVPLLLRQHTERPEIVHDMGKTLITIRRLAIGLVLVLAYGYYRMIGEPGPVAQALEKIEPNEAEDIQPYIEIAFQQGVLPKKGFDWLLARYGICSHRKNGYVFVVG